MAFRELVGCRLLVTGASEGIGRAIAKQAVERGCRVLAVARKQADLEALAEEVRATGKSLEILRADITVPEDRAAMVEAMQARFGGIDALVNNAGIGATGTFMDSDPEVLRRIFETNYFGTVELIRAFLPSLKLGVKPAIVNISSVLGKRGWPGRSLYSASKFALVGFSEALRAELCRDNISLLIVSPGLTQTNFSKNLLERKARIQMDHMRGMTAETVAEVTLNTLAKDSQDVTLTRLGRWLVLGNRLFPGLIDRIGKRKVRKVYAEEIAARYSQADA
ncbi:MAG: SDR family NAD(P)-dependent oxidoreductase [Fimbriiglobus sp.]